MFPRAALIQPELPIETDHHELNSAASSLYTAHHQPERTGVPSLHAAVVHRSSSPDYSTHCFACTNTSTCHHDFSSLLLVGTGHRLRCYPRNEPTIHPAAQPRLSIQTILSSISVAHVVLETSFTVSMRNSLRQLPRHITEASSRRMQCVWNQTGRSMPHRDHRARERAVSRIGQQTEAPNAATRLPLPGSLAQRT